MLVGTAVLGFAAASVLIVLLPGPDTLVVLRNLLRDGTRGAVAAAVGVICGLLLWVLVAALGIAALLRASTTAYDALRIVGGAYLMWIGIRAIRARVARRNDADVAIPPAARPLLGSGFVSGLATDLLNPKVGVFFVTFLPAFVPHGADVAVSTLVFGAVFVLETVVYFAVLIRAADRVVGWMNDERTRRRMDRVVGLVFIGFGLRLATEG